MVIGLQPLEFSDCITDSPYFRQKLHDHERELQKTNQQIKRLIKELKDLLNAAKSESSLMKYVVIYKYTIVLISWKKNIARYL